MKNLILDFANLTAILRFGAMSQNASTLLMSDEDWANYFLDMMLVSTANYVNVLKADRVIITMESRSWRKTFYPLYKANRNAGKEADDKLDLFYDAVNRSADFLRDFTNAKVIKADEAEGDDVVAVLAQKFSAQGDTTTIVSTDGDFKQLLRYKGVKLFNPIKKVYVPGGYSHLDYITKLVKGDAGDNVPNSYPRIKPEIIESLTADPEKFEGEFLKVDKMIERQRFFIQNILEIEEIPEDLTDEEWIEVLAIAKEKVVDHKEKVKEAKADDNFKLNESLVSQDKRIKDIIKQAKKEDITEAKLLSVIQSFRHGFARNEKLICLKIENLPEHVTESVLLEYDKDHKSTKQSEFLKYVRKHKLREFAFGREWSTLKNIKNHD